MELKEIRIKNFRNYSGEHIFHLNKKVTVLYGDNGFGKSTFFDALEWCLTGSINRFENNVVDLEFENATLINEKALKLDESECSVELRFDNYMLKRYFTTTNGVVNNTYVDLKHSTTDDSTMRTNTIHGKANVDRELKYIFMPNSTDSSFNIKQPYVLSQDQVTDFVVKDSPKQRYKALANLVGLNAVVNYSENLRRIIKELNSKLKIPNEIILSTEGVIKSYDQENKMYFEDIIFAAQKIPLQLSEMPKQYQGIINDNVQSINSMIAGAKDQLDILERLEKEKWDNLYTLIEKEAQITVEIQRYEKHQNYIDNNISKLRNKISTLTRSVEYQTKHDQVQSELQKLVLELNKKTEVLNNIQITDLIESVK